MKRESFGRYFLSLIVMLLGIVLPVYAAEITDVSIEDGDMINISTTGNVKQYCIGTSIGSGTCYDSTSNNVKISAPNGKWVIWVVDASNTSSSSRTVDVVNSCSDNVIKNGTGSGDYTRCFKTTSNAFIDPLPLTSGEVVSCASGYSLDAIHSIMQDGKDCPLKAGAANQVLGGIRYCTRVYHYVCVANSGVSSPYLSSLSIDGVNLSPSFVSNTLVYAGVTDKESITINATPKDNEATYVDGLAPRTVKLNYGLNKVYIKVKSRTGNIATYTLNITRKDNRSSNNNLRSLTVSSGSLTPGFNANTIKYSLEVPENVDKITIGASLADSKSSFVDGYGPRSVSLNYGVNKYEIRVKSETGKVRTYTIEINRAGGDANPLTQALLKSLVLNDGEVKLDFDSNVFSYNINVPYEVTNLLIVGTAMNEADTIKVEGGNDLQVGENEVKVIVTSENGSSNTYNLYVIRKDEEEGISSNSYLTNIEIKGKKLKFDAKEHEYNITINKNETELDITVIPADENSIITVEGNEDLKVGSQIKITVTAEDGSTQDYFLNVVGIKKGVNIFLVIVIVIIIVLVLAYLLLRIMGYRIYINLDAFKAWFPKKKKKSKK